MALRSLTLGTTLLVIMLGGTGLTAGHAAADPSALGHDLYQRLSCHGCHTLQGRGGEVGPVLDGVGSRLSLEKLKTQLLTPHQRRTDSRMPSFAFVRPWELQELLDFLQSLK